MRAAQEIPCSASSLLRRPDLRKGATVLSPVKDKARRRRAGLRPSLTCPARGGLPAGRSGRRDNRLTIEQRDDGCFSEPPVIQVVAAVSSVEVAWLGSNGLPVLSTPKHRCSSLRIAAPTICLGLSRPWSFKRWRRAATSGFQRIAARAGK